ncbi:hypothetical protein EJB05_13325, partial [Eragrostis curvula]
MLQLLNGLRNEMCRGHHTLDTYKCRALKDQAPEDHQTVSPSFRPSIFNPAKRFRFRSESSSSSSEQERIKEALGSLEIAIRDASELVVFLSGCPRLYRQPYNMYLLLDKCMFRRQMEMERIINFLLQEEAPGAEYPCVLPIIGPGRVGKTTMIEHACNDDRVRNHFSKIVGFSQDSMKDEKKIASLSDCDVIKHHNRAVQEERILVVIELPGKLMKSLGGNYTPTANIILEMEVRTFGSTNMDVHPKLASIAMEMAGSRGGAWRRRRPFPLPHPRCWSEQEEWSCSWRVKELSDAVEALLRLRAELLGHDAVAAALDPVRAWMRRVQEAQDDVASIRDCTVAKLQREVVAVLGLRDAPTEQAQVAGILLLDGVWERLDLERGGGGGRVEGRRRIPRFSPESPPSSVGDSGTAADSLRARGKFKVLLWRSHIPPHYSYMLTCEVRKPQQGMVSRKKRVQLIES